MSLQEKFQITVPTKEEAGEKWVTFNSQRDTEGSPRPDHGEKFNKMPPGMDIGNQENRTDFKHGFGGDTDVSGGNVNDAALGGRGFTRLKMKGTDDQYSGEHVDLFYGCVEDEKGNEGFCERNNYLDRA